MPSSDEPVIAATIAALNAAFRQVEGGAAVPAVFTDAAVLARPPFTYVHALAAFFARRKPALGWAALLREDGAGAPASESESERCASKKDRLAFLSRLLAVVARVDGRRWDVLVAPSKVLCGQDVAVTHAFLRALAAATLAPPADAAAAAGLVLAEGDASVYRRGVRTRKGFTSFQARVRGGQVRRQYPPPCPPRRDEMEVEEDAGNDSEEVEESEDLTVPKPKPNSEPALVNDKAVDKAPKKKSNLKADADALLESYQAMLSRKAAVEDDVKVSEAKLNRANDKLIRILNLGTKHKTRAHAVPYAGLPRPPLSAPSIGMNPVIHHGSYKIETAFGDTITNFSERQRNIKQKERRVDDRESRLKQRFVKSKQKETELKVQEERISDLAGKMRKQQLQLKEQRLAFERSKLVEPPVPPDTSRPCLLCTEKKMSMRNMRAKMRQRTRTLHQRETDVVGRAHELRRRETRLAQREQILAEWEHQQQESTEADDFLLEYEEREAPPPERHQRRRRHQSDAPERTEDTLPDLREGSAGSGRDKGARKRRRRKSPREKRRPNTPVVAPTPSNEDNVGSMRASFGESIPTIVEETPAEEQEDSIVEEMFREADSEPEANAADPTRRRKSSVVPTDIRRARQRLGIAKAKLTDAGRRDDKPPSAARLLERRVSQPPSPKRRHVFTFERRESQLSRCERQHAEAAAAPSPAPGAKPAASVRNGEARPRMAQEKPDDWISSFDVQMKCAINRLKDLV